MAARRRSLRGDGFKRSLFRGKARDAHAATAVLHMYMHMKQVREVGAATGPTRNNLRDPEPPRRRLEYPRGGAGGGELPQYDNGPAGEPEGRGRRAPGGPGVSCRRGRETS